MKNMEFILPKFQYFYYRKLDYTLGLFISDSKSSSTFFLLSLSIVNKCCIRAIHYVGYICEAHTIIKFIDFFWKAMGQFFHIF